MKKIISEARVHILCNQLGRLLNRVARFFLFTFMGVEMYKKPCPKGVGDACFITLLGEMVFFFLHHSSTAM